MMNACYYDNDDISLALSFPGQLCHLLSANSMYPIVAQAIGFMPHGRAFQVHNMELFCDRILPVWFGHTDWELFLQELYNHGFGQISRQGADEGAFYHELFLFGMPNLAATIQKRSRVNGWHADHDEPNFSRMPILVDTTTTSSDGVVPVTFLGRMMIPNNGDTPITPGDHYTRRTCSLSMTRRVIPQPGIDSTPTCSMNLMDWLHPVVAALRLPSLQSGADEDDEDMIMDGIWIGQ